MNTKPRITLATLPQATAQEVFDQVKEHLLSQGVKSQNGETCRYRTTRFNSLSGEKETLMCAAGCLISDMEYTKGIDNFESEDTSAEWIFLVADKLVPNEHVELINDLQGVHDIFNPYEWTRELQKVAQDHSLN